MSQFTHSAFFESMQRAFEEGDPHLASKEREQEHVRQLQLLYHAIARGEFAESLNLATEDIVLEILGPPAHPMVGRWEGRAAVAEAMVRNFGLVTDQKPEVTALVAQGDMIVLMGHETGRIEKSGRAYEVNWVQHFVFRDARVAMVRELFDSAEDLT